MVEPFSLNGYDVLAPLDAFGRSWRAVCLADGARVVLRRWVGGAVRLAEVRRRAALWGSVAREGAVAVRDAVAIGDDLVVVSELAAGGGLDALVARRGGLTPGQVVTVVAPIAQALASAHDQGLVHGRVSLSNVVLDPDGRPMLTDWLLAGDGEPAADVTALAAMALDCLRDDGPDVVQSALRSAVDARALADELLSAVPAEPLLATSAPAGPVVVARHRGVGVGVGVVVTIAIAVAIGGGVLWGRGDSAAHGATLLPSPSVSMSATPTATATSSAIDGLSLVSSLERRRLRALASGDRRLLEASELRGTTLWRYDVRVVSRLAAVGARLRGAHVFVQSAHLRSVQPARVVVDVVDALTSYDVVDHRGVVLRHCSARASRAARVVLVRRRGQWLIAAVSR